MEAEKTKKESTNAQRNYTDEHLLRQRASKKYSDSDYEAEYKKEQNAIAKREEDFARVYNKNKRPVSLAALGSLAIAAGAASSAATVVVATVAFPVAVGLGAVYLAMNIYQHRHVAAAEEARENAKRGPQFVDVPGSTEFEEYGPEDFETAEFDDEGADLTEEA